MTERLKKTRQDLSRKLGRVWSGLCELAEDNAYERYLQRQKQTGSRDILSRQEFYRQRLERKYSRPHRCC